MGEVIFVILYIIVNVVVSILQTSGFIAHNYARLIVQIAGLIFLLLEINRVKKLNEEAGDILFPLRREATTLPIFRGGLYALYLLIVITCSLSLYKIPESLPVSMLIYLVVYDLYADFFVNYGFTEKGLLAREGLFARGILIEWPNIKSYVWNAPTFNSLKDYTRLVIKINTWLGTYEIKLLTAHLRKIELDKFLKQKIDTSD